MDVVHSACLEGMSPIVRGGSLDFPRMADLPAARTLKNVSLVSNRMIADADYVSLHIPKQADGSAVIGKAEFASMKDGVRLINAARGGVIDEDALIEALDSGKVAAIALDVFENEPNPRADLLSHEKIACTPHIGAATGEAQDRIGTELADKIIATFGEQ